MKKTGLIVATCFTLGLFSALLFGWTATYDTTTPAGTDSPSVIDDRIREVKLGVQERQNVDHYWPLAGSQVSDDDAGKHRKVTFQEVLGTKPTLTDGQLAIYTKLTDSNEAIWLESDAGTERQLTTGSGLALKLVDADGALVKTGDQTFAGSKTFSDNVKAQVLYSQIADGDAPLVVTSTTKVANLNVDQVDGLHIEKYDSGWFAATVTTPYTKIHGLSGVPSIVQVFYSDTSDGSGDVVSLSFSPYGEGGWAASACVDLDATNIVHRTGTALAFYYDKNGVQHQKTTGYLKIVGFYIDAGS